MPAPAHSARQSMLICGGFAAFFLIYFSSLPLHSCLPANGDTWLYVALFNNYGNNFLSLLGCAPHTTSLYPESAAYLYGEPSFASGAIFLFLKLFAQSDIAYYLFISTVFAANASAVYALAKQYKMNTYGAILSGFIFACSPFIFGNIDNQNAIAFFPGIIALIYFLRYIDQQKKSHLFITAIFLSLQIYFSGYLFLFALIAVMIIGLSRFREISIIKTGSLIFATTLVLIFPYLQLYFFKSHFHDSYDIAKHFHAETEAALQLSDIFSLPTYSRIYKYFSLGGSSFSFHQLFPGLTVSMLLIASLFRAKSHLRREALLLMAGGIILAFGTQLTINGNTFHTPLFYLDKLIHYTLWFRIPIRAYILAVLGIALLSGFSFDLFWENTNRKWRLLFFTVPLFLFLECVPMPFQGKAFEVYAKEAESLKNQLAKLPEGNVLQLPSSILSKDFKSQASTQGDGSLSAINELQREHLYMFYQSQFDRNCINGSNGFIPLSRIKNDDLLRDIQKENYFSKLMIRNQIRYIVFHKKLAIRMEELKMLEILKANPKLKSVSLTTDFEIFEYQ